jgi:hypothetical protein
MCDIICPVMHKETRSPTHRKTKQNGKETPSSSAKDNTTYQKPASEENPFLDETR